MRINKYLASCGVASRRGAEEFIVAGCVSINGNVARSLHIQIGESDVVALDGRVVRPAEGFVYIMLNKPRGVVTTCKDEKGRRTVLDLVKVKERIFPVGRLDYDTEGLLILTNDGEFARRVTNPRNDISKKYIATLDRIITSAQIKALEQGVIVDGEMTLPAKVESTISKECVSITITQGRNRQVRKMFETQGLRVTHLKRVAIGGLELGDLKLGQWKNLSKEELTLL